MCSCQRVRNCLHQILSLFRDYDLRQPAETSEALGWADALNIGVSLVAPECFIRETRRFYVFYIATMTLQVRGWRTRRIEHMHCVGMRHGAPARVPCPSRARTCSTGRARGAVRADLDCRPAAASL